MLDLIRKSPAMLALLTLCASAQASGPTAVPEPGVLELVGLGAAVAIAIALAKRRK